MIINEEGTYTLKYTATDECGKSSTVDRELVVTDNSPRRTVLYTDGTFIINERQVDEAHNIELHGAATNVYVPFDPNGATNVAKYIFASFSSVPWRNEVESILSVEIGSEIHPTSTANWFYRMTNLASVDLTNLEMSDVTSVKYMFYNCKSLASIDVSGWDLSSCENMEQTFNGCEALLSIDMSHVNANAVENMASMFNSCKSLISVDISGITSKAINTVREIFAGCSVLKNVDFGNITMENVTDMYMMFRYCRAIETLDLSSFDTANVTNMRQMFNFCEALKTIYVSSSFVVDQVTDSSAMFSSMSTNLVGGAGTVWSSSNPTDATYAHIDGGTSNPGYFTARL